MGVHTMKFKKETSLRKISFVTWIVFLTTLVFTLINLTSAIFPAFLLISLGGTENTEVNPFEIGIWGFPLLITNFIIFALPNRPVVYGRLQIAALRHERTFAAILL